MARKLFDGLMTQDTRVESDLLFHRVPLSKGAVLRLGVFQKVIANDQLATHRTLFAEEDFISLRVRDCLSKEIEHGQGNAEKDPRP